MYNISISSTSPNSEVIEKLKDAFDVTRIVNIIHVGATNAGTTKSETVLNFEVRCNDNDTLADCGDVLYRSIKELGLCDVSLAKLPVHENVLPEVRVSLKYAGTVLGAYNKSKSIKRLQDAELIGITFRFDKDFCRYTVLLSYCLTVLDNKGTLELVRELSSHQALAYDLTTNGSVAES